MLGFSKEEIINNNEGCLYCFDFKKITELIEEIKKYDGKKINISYLDKGEYFVSYIDPRTEIPWAFLRLVPVVTEDDIFVEVYYDFFENEETQLRKEFNQLLLELLQ